jgi:ATP synthase F1 delta subunit
MLRKTASTLWTRFVPAARQAYPAAASSMKRVRHRSRAIARVSARAMRLRFFFLIASLTLSRLSIHPVRPQPRWFSATTEDGGEDGGEDVEEYEDDEEEWEYDEHAVRRTPRHRHRARLRRPSARRRRRRSRAVRLFFPAAPAQPVRPPRAVRLRGVHRREQGRRLGESPVRDQDGARPRNSSDAASRRQLRRERSTSTREKRAKPRPSRFRRLVCLILPARLPPRVSDPLFLPPPLSVHAQLVDAANMDEKFRNFLYDPTMPKAKKIAGITEFCDGAGFDKITKSFLCVTAENGRLKETSKILGCLEEYSLKAAGQVKATVTSAFPLNEDQLTRLTGLIKKKLDDPEDELTVETKVDSKLVGGFTVAMGEDFYDLSLMTRLRHMENELAKPLR